MTRWQREAFVKGLRSAIPDVSTLSGPAAAYIRGSIALATQQPDSIDALRILRDQLKAFNPGNPYRWIEGSFSGESPESVQASLARIATQVERVLTAAMATRMSVAHVGASPLLQQFYPALAALGDDPVGAGVLRGKRLEMMSNAYRRWETAQSQPAGPERDLLAVLPLREALTHLLPRLQAQGAPLAGLREAMTHATHAEGAVVLGDMARTAHTSVQDITNGLRRFIETGRIIWDGLSPEERGDWLRFIVRNPSIYVEIIHTAMSGDVSDGSVLEAARALMRGAYGQDVVWWLRAGGFGTNMPPPAGPPGAAVGSADEPEPPGVRFRLLAEAERYLEAFGIELERTRPPVVEGRETEQDRNRRHPSPHSVDHMMHIIHSISPTLEGLEERFPGLLRGLRLSAWTVNISRADEAQKEAIAAGAQRGRTMYFGPLDNSFPADASSPAALRDIFLHELGHFIDAKTSPHMHRILRLGTLPVALLEETPGDNRLAGQFDTMEDFLRTRYPNGAPARSPYFSLPLGGHFFILLPGEHITEVASSLSLYPGSSLARDPSAEAIAEILAHFLRQSGPTLSLDNTEELPWTTHADAPGFRTGQRGLAGLVTLTLWDAMAAWPDDGHGFVRADSPSLHVIRRGLFLR